MSAYRRGIFILFADNLDPTASMVEIHQLGLRRRNKGWGCFATDNRDIAFCKSGVNFKQLARRVLITVGHWGKGGGHNVIVVCGRIEPASPCCLFKSLQWNTDPLLFFRFRWNGTKGIRDNKSAIRINTVWTWNVSMGELNYVSYTPSLLKGVNLNIYLNI